LNEKNEQIKKLKQQNLQDLSTLREQLEKEHLNIVDKLLNQQKIELASKDEIL